jgi:hypothetical protein
MKLPGGLNCTNFDDNVTWSPSTATIEIVNLTQFNRSSVQSPPSAYLTAYDKVKFLLYTLAFVCNVAGNGLTLTAIRKTPELRTKSDIILGSLTVFDLIVAVDIIFYTAFSTTLNFRPYICTLAETISAAFSKAPAYVSSLHLVVVAVDRYMAVVYPFAYEDILTDGVVRDMLAAAWIIGCLLGVSHWMWLIDRSKRPICEAVSPAYGWLAVILFVAVTALVVPTNLVILKVAWNQHVRIHSEIPVVSTPRNVKFMSSATMDQQQQDRNKLQSSQSQQQPEQQHSEASHDREHKQAKARLREFKAVYLTTAVVLSFVVLWFPLIIGRGLQAAGHSESYVSTLVNVGNGLGIANSCLNWFLFGAVSKKYRQAYWRLLRGCVR